MLLTLLTAAACLAGTAGAAAGSEPAAALTARFIGNESFEITDGSFTLLTDFPYESGYSGYMTYRMEDVRPAGRVVTLITHGHRDHFLAAPFLSTSWEILGPREVTRDLPAARVLPLSTPAAVGPLTVHPLLTPHAGREHYSYRVEWAGLRLYFVGDTEDTTALLEQKDLDAAFVTPWLLDSVRAKGKKVDARLVVIYHHTAAERIDGCEGCWIPRQGDRRELSSQSRK